MKSLKPDCNFELDHRAYFLRGGFAGSSFIAAATDGHVTLVDPASKTSQVHRPTNKLAAICLHPTKPIFARMDGKSGLLIIQNLAGDALAEIRPPQLAPGSRAATKQGFTDCHFEESGDFLWLVSPLSDDEAELLLIETDGWSVVHKAVVDDPFGASYWSFHRTGRAGLVSLWIAAAVPINSDSTNRGL